MHGEPPRPTFLEALKDPVRHGWPDSPFLRIHAYAWIALDPSPEAQDLAKDILSGLPDEARRKVLDLVGG